MQISKQEIDKLKMAPYNPRKDLKPGDVEYEKLKRSIEHFGYVEPIIVNDRTGVVIGGHQRVKVLKDLGYKEADVVHVDLSETDEKALNIALNKISGDWDAEKLEDLLRELNLDNNIDIELTGFDTSELDTLFSGSLGDNEDDPEDDEDTKSDREKLDEFCKEAEGAIHNPRDIKLGDKWKLGSHVLMCGDSFKDETLTNLLDGNTCSLVFTDPPYQYDSFDENSENNLDRNGKRLIYDSLKEAYKKGFCEFSIEKVEYLFKYKIKSMYFCCNRHDLIKYMNLAIKYNYNYDIHVLYKQSCAPIHTSFYLNDVEYIVFMRLPGAVFNGRLPGNYYHHLQKEPDNDEIIEKQFYSHVCFSNGGEGRKDSDVKLSHPTIKPLRLIIPRIAISSNEGDIVVDLFCGSGSTLIACEKLDRRCFTIEIDPEYCNETIDRWEALTGQKAVKM